MFCFSFKYGLFACYYVPFRFFCPICLILKKSALNPPLPVTEFIAIRSEQVCILHVLLLLHVVMQQLLRIILLKSSSSVHSTHAIKPSPAPLKVSFLVTTKDQHLRVSLCSPYNISNTIAAAVDRKDSDFGHFYKSHASLTLLPIYVP